MNIEPEFREKLSRIALIGESCGLVITPGVLTFYLGYGPLFLIILESLLIIAGFFTLTLALTDPFPKWADIKTTWPVFLIFFIAIPYALTTTPRFPPLDSFAGISTIFVSIVSSIYLGKTLYGFHRQSTPKPALVYLVLCALTITWTLYLWTGSPPFPTDEMTIDYYAAHLFLLGLNPYNPALTSNVYSYYGLALNGIPVNQMLNVSTPILTGYLWTSHTNSNYINGQTYNITITPLEAGQGIPDSGYYRLIAYYGYNYGSAGFALHSGTLSQQ